MSPYEHFFWNYAFFYRRPWAWKVGLGGLFPDLSYMLAFVPRIFHYRSFMEWMRDPLWDLLWASPIARSVHSFLVWGVFFALVYFFFRKNLFRTLIPFLMG